MRAPQTVCRSAVIVLAAVLITGGAVPPTRAGEADGTLLGVSTLLDSGDPAGKLDVVFLGDGFREDEQDLFDAKVDAAVQFFLATHPFEALHCAFNIHRVNVASRESGTDVPATCGGEDSPESARTRATAMDTTYCAGGDVFRCVGSTDQQFVRNYALMAPGSDYVVVLVNDGGYGGCRFGNLTFVTLDDFRSTIVHELGHAIADLADEYTDDDPGTTSFTGSEPGRANITIAQSRETLKWGDLVLGSTAVPTSTCLAPASVAADLVGTFEGANQRFKCGIFRPQQACRMRRSGDPFCAVCRRKLIRDIQPSLCQPLAVTLTELLVRDAQEPWHKGDGEIYFDYTVASNSESISGRWPGPEGEVDFDDGDSRSLDNFLAAVVPPPRPGISGSIDVRVRENDWPDGDDGLRDDAGQAFSSAGGFEIDESEYRLRGAITSARLHVLLDTLHVKNDHDGFGAGSGDIYVRYTVSNGTQSIQGRWPAAGTAGISTRESREVGILAGVVPTPPRESALSVRVEVWDADSLFTGGDDRIGDDTFTYDASQNFGSDAVVHVEDRSGYRITLSIVNAP